MHYHLGIINFDLIIQWPIRNWVGKEVKQGAVVMALKD
jgi:hypothetical protein